MFQITKFTLSDRIYPIEYTYIRIEGKLWPRQILRVVKVRAIWWGKQPCSFSNFMHVTRSSKSFEKYKIMRKLLSDPMTPQNNPEWRVITPQGPRKSWQVWQSWYIPVFLKSTSFVSFTDKNFKCLTEIIILSVRMSDTKIQDFLHRTRTCLTENYPVWCDVSFCQTECLTILKSFQEVWYTQENAHWGCI